MDFKRLFKKHGVKTAPGPGLQPLSEAELEKVVGGAKGPSWRPGGASKPGLKPVVKEQSKVELKADDKLSAAKGVEAGTIVEGAEKVVKETAVTRCDLERIREKSAGFGVTGRQIPENLEEQIIMRNLVDDPFALSEGKELKKLFKINDIRWRGWDKWQAIYRTKNGKNIIIHFNYNSELNLFDDFKFKLD